MPSLNHLISEGAVCHCLRTKTMYYESVVANQMLNQRDQLAASHALPAGPFWCGQTQSLLGPDGGIADAENCRSGRKCCETA